MFLTVTDPLEVFDVLEVFYFCYAKMRDCVFHYSVFTFSLLDVFQATILFSWIGWVFYKCMHLLDD